MSNDTTLTHTELFKSIKLLLTSKHVKYDFELALYKIIPRDKIPESTLRHILIWILKNQENQGKAKCRLMLLWISALYDYDLIDMKDLHTNQCLFIRMLHEDILVSIVCKILQGVLVNRNQIKRITVQEIIRMADKSNSNSSYFLSLLLHIKSICPDKVPESFDENHIKCKFPEIPPKLKEHLDRCEDLSKRKQLVGHINWNVTKDKSKDVRPLVYINIFTGKYLVSVRKKWITEFNTIADLCAYPQSMLEYPANVLSLLGSKAGRHLLSISKSSIQDNFIEQVEHELKNYFLLTSRHPKKLLQERDYFLECLYDLMEICQQGIPSISEIILTHFQSNFMAPTKVLLELLTWTFPTSFSQIETKLLEPFYTYLVLSNANLFYELLPFIKRFLINFIIGIIYPKTKKKVQPFKIDVDLESMLNIWRKIIVWVERFLAQGITLLGEKIIPDVLRFYKTILLYQQTLVPSLTIPNLDLKLAYYILGGPSLTLINDFMGILFDYIKQNNKKVKINLNMDVIDEILHNYANVLCHNKPITFSGIEMTNEKKEVLNYIKSYLNINRHYSFVSYHGPSNIPKIKKKNPLLTDQYCNKLKRFGPDLVEFCQIFLTTYYDN